MRETLADLRQVNEWREEMRRDLAAGRLAKSCMGGTLRGRAYTLASAFLAGIEQGALRIVGAVRPALPRVTKRGQEKGREEERRTASPRLP